MRLPDKASDTGRLPIFIHEANQGWRASMIWVAFLGSAQLIRHQSAVLSSPPSCVRNESLGSRARHSQAAPDPPLQITGAQPHEAGGLALVRPAGHLLDTVPFSCRTSQGLDYVNIHRDSLRQGVRAENIQGFPSLPLPQYCCSTSGDAMGEGGVA